MHTCFSADSEATVTSMLDAAVEKGLEGVCITDHMDLDFPETPDFPANAFQFDLDEYFGQLNRLKEQYKGKLDLRIGVEIGLQIITFIAEKENVSAEEMLKILIF